MPKLEPTWQNLPTHFKKSLVKQLDLKSRLNLSSSSKSDHNLVQSCALEIHEIHLELFSAESNGVYPDYFYSIQETKNSKQRIHAVFDSGQEGVQFLMKLLGHLKSKVDTFDLSFKSQRGDSIENYHATMEEFSLELTSELEKIGSRKIKARSLNSLADFKTTDIFLDILNCFDPSTLTQLRIQPRVSDEIMSRIIASEYWPNLNSLRLQRKTTVSIEKLLPLNAFHLSVDRYCRELRPQDVLNLVQTFIDRNSPWASYFQVLTTPDHRYDMEGTTRELTRTSLDIERTKLSMCSKSEQSLIATCPVHFYKVSIDLPHDRNAEGFIGFQANFGSELSLRRFETLARAIQSFSKIFKHRESTIEWFSLSYSVPENDFMCAIGKFMKRVMDTLNGENHRINVSQFSYLSSWPITRDFVNILNCLNSSILGCLWIQPEIPEIVMNHLTSTDHWKHLNTLILNGNVSNSIAQLLPPNIYQITLDNYSGVLRPSDVEDLVKKFVSGNCSSLYGAFFKISTTTESHYDQAATLTHLDLNLMIKMRDTNLIFCI